MGVWLRNKSGSLAAMRDGRGFHNPVLALYHEPQYFKNLSASQFKDDRDVEVVEAKFIDKKIGVDKEGAPPVEYRAKLYAEVKEQQVAMRDIDKNLKRRKILFADLEKMQKSEAVFEKAISEAPGSARAHQAKGGIVKIEKGRAAIYEELEKIENALKIAGVNVEEIDALAEVDQALADLGSIKAAG
jgi:tetratricopeptide (TPR) repeat protein